MTLVFPAPRAVRAVRQALERAFLGLVTVLLAGSFLACVAYGFAFPAYPVWLALPPLTLLWAIALALASFTNMRWWLLLPLGALALAMQALYTSTFVGFTPLIAFETSGSTFLMSTSTIVLTFMGALADRRSSGALGTLVGCAIGQAGAMLGQWESARPITLDLTSAVLGVAVALGLEQLVRANRRAQSAEPALTEADAVTRLRRERHTLERRSAALVHDTILNELATLATSRPGPIAPRVLRQLRLSLTLVGDLDAGAGTDSERHPHADQAGRLRDVVAKARGEGLRVTVTGDLHALADLTPERARALPEAVEQALLNVVRHAGTRDAELAVMATADELTVMVTDDGRGFDQAAVAPDRLGLRVSVRERILSVGGGVQVWSSPGSGTSIVLTLPRTP